MKQQLIKQKMFVKPILTQKQIVDFFILFCFGFHESASVEAETEPEIWNHFADAILHVKQVLKGEAKMVILFDA